MATAELASRDKIAAAAIARWASVTIAGAPVACRPCPRCSARGRIDAYNFCQFGVCFSCGGDAVVPTFTPAQKAAIKRRDALLDAYYATLWADRHAQIPYVYPDGRTYRTTIDSIARAALEHLRENAPERFERLLTSVEQGRAADITAALIDYAVAGQIVP